MHTSKQPGKESAMSVLVLFRWEGDPDELLAAYEREFESSENSVRAKFAEYSFHALR